MIFDLNDKDVQIDGRNGMFCSSKNMEEIKYLSANQIKFLLSISILTNKHVEIEVINDYQIDTVISQQFERIAIWTRKSTHLHKRIVRIDLIILHNYHIYDPWKEECPQQNIIWSASYFYKEKV